MSPLLLSLIIALAINAILFLIAFRRQSDKLTDISYALSFIALVLFAFLRARQHGVYAYLLTAMVCAWGIRIGGFLLYRVMRKGKDNRFDSMRQHFWRFGRFWLGQALTVWLLMFPVSFALQRTGKLQALVYIGLVVWTIGLVVESIADFQKYEFSTNLDNKGKWIDQGIWHYSRHPNYFGEIAIWIGVYLVCLVAMSPSEAIAALISPILITTLLLFVSGVPVLEKSADKRWGELTSYQQYKSSTSLLIPLPKKR
jgi:steroid 5-alpha reductase family enzyme